MDDIKVHELKAGDRVGVSGYGWNALADVRTVAKRTATQVVLDDGSRWNKYGRKVGEGSTYHRQFLMTEQEAMERNAEERKKAARQALVREIRDLDFRTVDDDGLKMILVVAKDHQL